MDGLSFGNLPWRCLMQRRPCRMILRQLSLAAICIVSVLALVPNSVAADKHQPADWRARVREELPLLGHRNWIAVVDSAYPLQTSGGIETVETGSDQLEVVRGVLDELSKAKHVRPVIFTDAELQLVPESDAKGVSEYREALANLLGKSGSQSLPHEQIISKLDDAGKTFHILVLKTNLTVPYTSVFLRLDCGYWDDAAEKRLREKMAAK